MPIRIAIIEDNTSFALTIDKHFKRPGSEVLCVAVYGTAEAALVPCALLGMRQTSRPVSPFARW